MIFTIPWRQTGDKLGTSGTIFGLFWGQNSDRLRTRLGQFGHDSISWSHIGLLSVSYWSNISLISVAYQSKIKHPLLKRVPLLNLMVIEKGIVSLFSKFHQH